MPVFCFIHCLGSLEVLIVIINEIHLQNKASQEYIFLSFHDKITGFGRVSQMLRRMRAAIDPASLTTLGLAA